MPAVQEMAATLNAFSILQGAGEQPQASSQKKKKNRSKKKGGAGSNNQAAVQDPVPEQLAEEVVRSTPEPEVAVEDGFQLAGAILRQLQRMQHRAPVEPVCLCCEGSAPLRALGLYRWTHHLCTKTCNPACPARQPPVSGFNRQCRGDHGRCPKPGGCFALQWVVLGLSLKRATQPACRLSCTLAGLILSAYQPAGQPSPRHSTCVQGQHSPHGVQLQALRCSSTLSRLGRTSFSSTTLAIPALILTLVSALQATASIPSSMLPQLEGGQAGHRAGSLSCRPGWQAGPHHAMLPCRPPPCTAGKMSQL